MDSGNSGSMQSSSCGDEELDSRVDSITAFLNPSTHDNPNSNSNQNYPSALFDPLSSYFDPFSVSTPPQNTSFLLNLDMVWPSGLRSEPNIYTNMDPLMNPSSSASQTFSDCQDMGRVQLPNPLSASLSLPRGPENSSRAPSILCNQPNLVRNLKKRTRASRKAPTTVLTTDTSNFRAMVQEFTGIPAPPFSASPFPRTRFDLLNAALPSNVNTGDHLQLLRPFAQKYTTPPFLSSSSSFPSSSSNSYFSNTSNTSNLASSYNYQQLVQSQNLLNMQNQLQTFQSLLQPSPLPPNYSSSVGAQVSIAEVLNRNHGSVRADIGGIVGVDHNSLNDGDQGDQMRISFNEGSFDSSQQRVNDPKMIKYSGSSSNVHADKG
ncbi:hypothetical protein GIB67_006432 [Kingdonia uniflora]|uniref:VQ domain-containing protein n=1 Tax=Kingdonia uniflora TaxID=39325 RepID=A0A7J7NEY4_9MAGN|nr:hypothetical protein GIB67_006432 [Kingdonia uniflora]